MLAIYLIKAVQLLFLCYIIMILLRIIGSWFPSFRYTKFMHFIAHYTDPYLNLFRRFIPPIGGTLDLSPLLGYIVLKIVEAIVIRILIAIF
ncbi:MAG: YggT family protein [Simkania negevensis]|nr:YggT family protein [Simkania negevensis]